MTLANPPIPEDPEVRDLTKQIGDLKHIIRRRHSLLRYLSDFIESYQGLIAELIDFDPDASNEFATLTFDARTFIDNLLDDVQPDTYLKQEALRLFEEELRQARTRQETSTITFTDRDLDLFEAEGGDHHE